MENKLELVNQNSNLLCKTENKFTKEFGLNFAKAVTKMSLAKNIKLAVGTIAVWEECLIEDIRSGIMDYEDFLAATRKVIREPLYNRIDYADIYKVAVEIGKNRRMKTLPDINFSKTAMPKEVRELAEKMSKQGG